MAFCLTFGTHDFTSQIKGAENITAQCHNCGNWSARCITRWPFFTICFIPLIPLATHKYKEVYCDVCRAQQDLGARPDVQSMIDHPGQQPQAVAGGNQGWNGQQQQQQGGYYGQGGGNKPQYH